MFIWHLGLYVRGRDSWLRTESNTIDAGRDWYYNANFLTHVDDAS